MVFGSSSSTRLSEAMVLVVRLQARAQATTALPSSSSIFLAVKVGDDVHHLKWSYDSEVNETEQVKQKVISQALEL